MLRVSIQSYVKKAAKARLHMYASRSHPFTFVAHTVVKPIPANQP